MGNLFSLDSPLFKFGNLVADVLILSLIWVIFSIPIITIGASTTALFYVTTRRISDKEGYLLRDFLTSFKREFSKATIVWVIWSVMFFLVMFNLFYMEMISAMMGLDGIFRFIYTALQILIFIELIFILPFLFSTLARFQVNIRTLLVNSLFMANRHFVTSFTCAVLFVSLILAGLQFFPPFLFCVMGTYAMLASYMIVRVFKKYRPEIDKEEPMLDTDLPSIEVNNPVIDNSISAIDNPNMDKNLPVSNNLEGEDFK